MDTMTGERSDARCTNAENDGERWAGRPETHKGLPSLLLGGRPAITNLRAEGKME